MTSTSHIDELLPAGNTLYFAAGKLWRSNGATAGTTIVNDGATGQPIEFPFDLTAADRPTLEAVVQ